MPKRTTASRTSRAAAIALTLALTSVGPIAPAAFADGPPGTTSTASTGSPSSSGSPSAVPPALAARIAAGDAKFKDEHPQTAADKAIAEARRTGKPVPVPELTDEYSDTVATPEGHLSRTEHADPQRVKQDGHWAALDGTLVPDTQGGYRPKSAVAGVHLSGGGDGPLGTLTSQDGESLTIDSPFPLTKPALDPGGEALVYPEVAPGIDLKVTTSKYGSLSTVLVVKTAEAAKNPALKKVRFPTRTKGVTVKADKDSNLTAVTKDGKVRWHASAPQMWDSSTTAPAGGNAPKGASAAAPADGADATAPAASSAEGPGNGAKVATMATTATGDAVELTTDDTVLGKGQGPWFIDPGWLYDRREGNAWTWTQSAHPTTPNWGRTVANTGDKYAQPGVGRQGYQPAQGIERSYFQFDTSGYGDKIINSAVLSVWEVKSSDFDCTHKYTLDAYLTDPISGATTWNNAPANIKYVGSNDVGGAGQNGCGGATRFDYDVTSAYQGYASGNPTLAFGIYAHDESNTLAFKRMGYNPAVVIQYDVRPNTPTNPYASPAPSTAVPWSDNQGCDGNSIGWLNSSSGFNGAVTLNATVSSPVQSDLYGWMHIWDYADLSADVDQGNTPLTPNGGTASFQVKPGVIKDGHVYGWGALATDGLVGMSGSTPMCRFGVDLTPPTISVPGVDSRLSDAELATRFPPSGNGQVTRLHAGDTGVVPFSASDPAPGGNASGVACARWSWDPQFAGASWVCGGSVPTDGISVTPGRWGTNVLYTQVMDNARNVSPVAAYAFYVPWNPTCPPPVFGDVTGDGAPDILQPDQAGYLRTYNAPGNPFVKSPATTPVAAPADAPGGKGWGGVQLTHRGTLTGGNNVDDVIAHAPGAPELWVYPNPGNTGAYGRIDKAVPLGKPACVATPTENCAWRTAAGYNAKDWSGTLRIAALGDPVSTDLDPKLGFRNKTGLLTVESTNGGTDAALWYYPATNANTLGKPVQLAASGWKDKELITPGDWAKQGHPGLWTRNFAPSGDGAAKDDLFAYTFTTGTVQATDNLGNPLTDSSGKPLMVPTLAGLGAALKIGYVSTDTYPVLGSDGDVIGNGSAGLWGRRADGTIDDWWGVPTGPGTTTPGYSWQAGPVTIANTAVNPQQWALDGRTSGDSGDADKYPLYPNGDPATTYPGKAAFTADHLGNAGKATVFNGSTIYRTKNTLGSDGTTPGLDTTQSYSVAAWVKLDSTNDYETVLNLTGQERSPFYLQYSAHLHTWAFVLPDSDNLQPQSYYVAYDTTGRTTAQTGVWTHLTGSYNADTGVATLYVNGQAVGSVKPARTWKARGSLNIGGEVTDRYPAGSFVNGAISDARVYPYALTDPQVNALATTDSVVRIRTGFNSGKCLDHYGGYNGAPLAVWDCWNGPGQRFVMTSGNQIKAAGTGLCLGTVGAPVGNGTKVGSQPCGDAAAQTWIRRYDGSLVHQASGLCLDVHGWDTTNGSALDLWDCVGSANERWSVEASS